MEDAQGDMLEAAEDWIRVIGEAGHLAVNRAGTDDAGAWAAMEQDFATATEGLCTVWHLHGTLDISRVIPDLCAVQACAAAGICTRKHALCAILDALSSHQECEIFANTVFRALCLSDSLAEPALYVHCINIIDHLAGAGVRLDGALVTKLIHGYTRVLPGRSQHKLVSLLQNFTGLSTFDTLLASADAVSALMRPLLDSMWDSTPHDVHDSTNHTVVSVVRKILLNLGSAATMAAFKRYLRGEQLLCVWTAVLQQLRVLHYRSTVPMLETLCVMLDRLPSLRRYAMKHTDLVNGFCQCLAATAIESRAAGARVDPARRLLLRCLRLLSICMTEACRERWCVAVQPVLGVCISIIEHAPDRATRTMAASVVSIWCANSSSSAAGLQAHGAALVSCFQRIVADPCERCTVLASFVLQVLADQLRIYQGSPALVQFQAVLSETVHQLVQQLKQELATTMEASVAGRTLENWRQFYMQEDAAAFQLAAGNPAGIWLLVQARAQLVAFLLSQPASNHGPERPLRLDLDDRHDFCPSAGAHELISSRDYLTSIVQYLSAQPYLSPDECSRCGIFQGLWQSLQPSGSCPGLVEQQMRQSVFRSAFLGTESGHCALKLLVATLRQCTGTPPMSAQQPVSLVVHVPLHTEGRFVVLQRPVLADAQVTLGRIARTAEKWLDVLASSPARRTGGGVTVEVAESTTGTAEHRVWVGVNAQSTNAVVSLTVASDEFTTDVPVRAVVRAQQRWELLSFAGKMTNLSWSFSSHPTQLNALYAPGHQIMVQREAGWHYAIVLDYVADGVVVDIPALRQLAVTVSWANVDTPDSHEPAEVGSMSEDEEAGEEECLDAWACDHCTYENEPHRKMCDVCGAGRPVASALQSLDEVWNCASCTFANTSRHSCAICGTPKRASTASGLSGSSSTVDVDMVEAKILDAPTGPHDKRLFAMHVAGPATECVVVDTPNLQACEGLVRKFDATTCRATILVAGQSATHDLSVVLPDSRVLQKDTHLGRRRDDTSGFLFGCTLCSRGSPCQLWSPALQERAVVSCGSCHTELAAFTERCITCAEHVAQPLSGYLYHCMQAHTGVEGVCSVCMQLVSDLANHQLQHVRRVQLDPSCQVVVAEEFSLTLNQKVFVKDHTGKWCPCVVAKNCLKGDSYVTVLSENSTRVVPIEDVEILPCAGGRLDFSFVHGGLGGDWGIGYDMPTSPPAVGAEVPTAGPMSLRIHAGPPRRDEDGDEERTKQAILISEAGQILNPHQVRRAGAASWQFVVDGVACTSRQVVSDGLCSTALAHRHIQLSEAGSVAGPAAGSAAEACQATGAAAPGQVCPTRESQLLDAVLSAVQDAPQVPKLYDVALCEQVWGLLDDGAATACDFVHPAAISIVRQQKRHVFPQLQDWICKKLCRGEYSKRRLQPVQATVRREQLLEDCQTLMQRLVELYSISEVPTQGFSLTVTFSGEVGHGAGPTVEFYSQACRAFYEPAADMWRDVSAANSCGLYPTGQSHGVVRIKFETLGRLIGHAIRDHRPLDLPLSPAFCKLIVGDKCSLQDVQQIDPELANGLNYLQDLCFQQLLIQNDCTLAQAERELRLQTLACAVEALGLDFTTSDSGMCDRIELCDGGSERAVTLQNLSEYLELTLSHMLDTSVAYAVHAVQQGISSVIPLAAVQVWTGAQLAEMLGLNQTAAEHWDATSIQEAVRCDHGYDWASPQVLWLIQVLTELSGEDRRLFLQFVTGCPRLPAKGFKGLETPLTIVRRDDTYAGNCVADQMLPTCSTCTVYLKLPTYSSKEVLREKLLCAIRYGQSYFAMN